jgi:AcrR family transcriptional regulator
MNANPSAKTRILGAAASVVGRAGAAHLTIDAVAEQAKLSKGGVLYHFPNKRSMLEGMVEHVLGRVAERSAQHRAALQGGDLQNSNLRNGNNVTVRSLILAQQEDGDDERAMSLAILAAAAEDPDLLDPAREAIAGWFAQIGEESLAGPSNDQLGVMLLLANEGLRFLGMLNLLPMDSAERERIWQRMLSMAEAGKS